jgi:glycosyltransferase involved in cell wall biosynthesis
MITTFYPPENFGGDGIFVQNLSSALASRGHEVHVIHCSDSYRLFAGNSKPKSISSDARVTVHSLRSAAGPLSPIATHQTGRPWFKQIASILDGGFDVIHFHNISLVGGPALMELGAGIKLYTAHEYWLVCPTSLLLRFGRELCDSPRCFSCALAQGRPPQPWRMTGMLDRCARQVDAFLAPSRFSIEKHRELGFRQPMIHLPNFVPSKPRIASPAPGEPYFLFVGRLESDKGAHTLIDLFRRWGKAKLLIAGKGAQEAHLRELAEGSNRIELLGHVAGDDLRTLYRGAVAAVVPSLSYEAFPLVVLEAAREETPVVVRRLGSLAEAVEESGGGLSYESEQELPGALDALLSDRGFRDQLGQQGFRYFESHWSEDAHLDRYFEIIESVRQSRRGLGAAV